MNELATKVAQAAIEEWNFAPGEHYRDVDGFCDDGFTCDTVGAAIALHADHMDLVPFASTVFVEIDRILDAR